MFDPNLCQQVSPTRLWTFISRALLIILGHPLLAIALLAALALIPWLLNRPKWKKHTLVLGVLGLCFYIFVATPLLSSLGTYFLTRNLPPDSGESADAIVVLGRGYWQNDVRAQAAANLWRAKRAPIIFSSGRKDALFMADLLHQQTPPINPGAIAGEPCSLTTEQNAEFTAAILRPQGIRKIILITDQPHMRRSQLVFESFGFAVIPHIVPFNNNNPAKKNFLVIRESVGLLSYGLQGRYAQKEVPPESVISNG